MVNGKAFLTVGVALAATLMVVPEGASAAVLVHVIQNDPTPGDASIVPSSLLPSADFVSPDINFQISNSSSTTLATFLNNPVFTDTQNGFNPLAFANNSFLEITAQTFLMAGANSFVVGHDDGVVLTFADPAIGIVVNAPGPTGFVSTPFNVTAASAGLYSFDLKYTECCGGPANLLFTINGAPIGAATPEPATVLLSGLSLAALGFYSRFRLFRAN